ncbi:hypothetical protein [Bradyrhizobium sp. WCU1]
MRRIATGADFHIRLFARDAETAEARAKDRARFAIGMRLAALKETEARGVAVFRIVSCAVSADQSRPSEAAADTPRDVMADLALSRVSVAKDMIASAERALGRLTAGQRRDLLKDNTDWSERSVLLVVDLIERGAR